MVCLEYIKKEIFSVYLNEHPLTLLLGEALSYWRGPRNKVHKGDGYVQNW
jgi:hypothetical protein